MLSFGRRIVRILEEGGHIEDLALLTEASEIASGGEKSVTEFLLERQVLPEDELLGILADRLGVPPVDLSRVALDQPELIERMPEDLSKESGAIPLSLMGQNCLTVAVSNPLDVVRQDDLRLATGCELRLALALEPQIQTARDRLYRSDSDLSDFLGDNDSDEIKLKEEDDDVIDLAEVTGESDEAPIIRLVNYIIYQAIKAKASDIHVEPFEKRVLVRYRVDGALSEAMEPPKRLQNAITSRLKIMADLDIAEKRKPQDGKFQVRAEGRQIDFRVSSLPCLHGEKVVLRILDASNLTLGLDQLGFEQKALADFKEAIESPYGMLLVTGPTGSGKTTTLYSAVKEIMTPEQNFVTVEDPVEYQLEGINQVQVTPKTGLSFAAALRSILRQDPDVVMVGEIRDTETINIAVKAALTGHLVLSTLHTNDAASTVTRMIDMGVDPFMVASATLLVSAQRLMRRLCPHCKEAYEAPADRLLHVGLTEAEAAEKPTIYRPVGCSRCTQGYTGRFAILETLPISDEVKRAVVEGRSALQVRNLAIEEGMITLRRAGLLNALRGITSIEEVLRVTLSDHRRTFEADAGA